jgi:hypothetical protein
MRLGISSEDLRDLIVARLEFNEEYETAVKAQGRQIQNRGAKTPLRIKLGDKTSLFLFFSPTLFPS